MSKVKMHWCTGKINLSGQGFTIIWFDHTNPISWPEAQVLMAMHGEENVYDLKPVALGETTIAEEKERLALKLGYKPTEHVFPGRNPRMETLMPAHEEQLPHADQYGQLTGGPLTGAPTPNHPPPLETNTSNGHPIEEPPSPTPKPIPPQPEDDEDEPDDAKSANPPPGPAVFKPGKHPRPYRGA
jgi:hypothetical protein